MTIGNLPTVYYLPCGLLVLTIEKCFQTRFYGYPGIIDVALYISVYFWTRF